MLENIVSAVSGVLTDYVMVTVLLTVALFSQSPPEGCSSE